MVLLNRAGKKVSKGGQAPAILKRADVLYIVNLSDLHGGSRLALVPPDFRLTSGERCPVKRLQRKLWIWWEEFNKWILDETHRQPFGLVFNGDAVENLHHRNTATISQKRIDHRRVAYDVLKPLVKRAEWFYMIKGTAVHGGGEECEDEEELASQLGALPDRDGNAARFHLRKAFHGKIIDYQHHISVTGIPSSRTQALMRELDTIYFWAAKIRRPPPDVVVRSHRHQHDEIRPDRAIVFTTPAWQLKIPVLYRMMGRNNFPEIGGSLIAWENGRLETRHLVRYLEETRVE